LSRDRDEHDPVGAMTLPDAWHVLERTGWLRSCSSEVRGSLRGIASLLAFAAGEYLYRAGDVPNGVFGLVRGAIDSLIPRLDGEEIVVHRAGGGFWIGDLALFSKQRRLLSLRAATSVTVVHLPQKELIAMTQRQPTLVADFYRLSHINMETTLSLLGNLAISGAENRVALRLMIQRRVLTDEAGWIPLGQESLAELVALSTQTVRRALRQLESQGLLELGYRRIRILDERGLAGLCGYRFKL
jgi:CRP/FNR family transcriptional regulator, cyclic AMP receptor protein